MRSRAAWAQALFEAIGARTASEASTANTANTATKAATARTTPREERGRGKVDRLALLEDLFEHGADADAEDVELRGVEAGVDHPPVGIRNRRRAGLDLLATEFSHTGGDEAVGNED